MSYSCGIIYFDISENAWNRAEKRLPIVKLSTHTTILSTTSRTVLSQTFVNNKKSTIDECRYDFPLYDGVSVVGFTCHIGARTIEGVVKEKTKAKATYEEAKFRGKTAGLLAQGPTSDVFSTTLGNIPAGETIVVRVTYIGELKHDVAAQCTKFTIPTKIAPRYGTSPFSIPGSTAKPDGNGMEITVDISMGSGTTIREVRSPSHPIAIKLGRTSITPTTGTPQLSQASATLSQGSANLDKDFHIEIVNDITKQPKALLETYANNTRQRALMVTLVPEINLAQAKPEIVIVADRSGSMGGNKIRTLVRALKILLRSLPVGIHFNICSFGSTHSFLWDKSHEYGEDSLAEATKHVDGFDANYGGTETLAAVKASIGARDVRQDLALILCTDGDIWQQEEFFSYLNNQVRDSEKHIRVFPLGIGDSVSSALIEGAARAGKGFASTVGENEKLDGKVIRMLKGALTENVDYTFDVKYGQNEDDEDDGFVLIDHVADSLSVVSLGDSQTLVSEPSTENLTGPVAGLPAVAVPKYLQAPHEITPLYPSARATLYVLISPDSPQKQPISVLLKGLSSGGPIEYEIPVEIVAEPGKTIHQLAARKAVGDLEEGRGWLNQAKDAKGILFKDKFGAGPSLDQVGVKPKASKFHELVEREAVRLGVEYQVGGKYCSFVAVEGNEVMIPAESTYASARASVPSPAGSVFAASAFGSRGGLSAMGSGNSSRMPLSASSGSGVARLCSMTTSSNGGTFGASTAIPVCAQYSGGRGGYASGQSNLFGATSYTSGPSNVFAATPYESDSGEDVGFGLFDDGSPAPKTSGESPGGPLDIIISLQHFTGFWEFNKDLLSVCGIGTSAAAGTMLASASSGQPSRGQVWATVLAITFLERKMTSEKDTWELIVDKAKVWLQSNGVSMEKEAETEPLKALLSEL
ncbi:hypothetical protein G7Y79_00008g024410 [Physcia stellaris]|nr:hypothetical protein G7Y79_00008g024410 [Physcia stellaris]